MGATCRVLSPFDQLAANGHGTGRHWKLGTGKDSHIVLVPQPSADLNDPLNWSSVKKAVVLSIILMGTAFVCVVPSPMLNVGIVPISLDLGQSFSAITKLNGYMLLATGAVAPLISAIARKYGKRPVFVISSIVGLIGCLVGETANNYDALVGGRVLQGVGASAYESLVTAVAGDLYFVHQCGALVAVVIFLLSSLSNGVSVVAGVITTRLGWHYNFHILLPFVAVQMVLVILFAPETTYNRPSMYNIDRTGSDYDISKSGDQINADHIETSAIVQEGGDNDGPEATTEQPVPKSFWAQLTLFNGIFTEKSLLSMVLACFAILFRIIASYNIFLSGLIMAWYVAMSVLAGVMFGAPPWNYDAAAVGYVSAGPLIGGCVATVFLALVSDPLIKFLSRKNNGAYQPEFRIPLVTVGGVFTVAGLVGFGHSLESELSIYSVATLWAVTLFGMSIVTSCTMAYALDAQPTHSVEIFIMNICLKNFFFYGLTTFIVDWYAKSGPAEVFDSMAGITGALCLTSVPMYIFGKRYRQFWSHHNLLAIARLDDGRATVV